MSLRSSTPAALRPRNGRDTQRGRNVTESKLCSVSPRRVRHVTRHARFASPNAARSTSTSSAAARPMAPRKCGSSSAVRARTSRRWLASDCPSPGLHDHDRGLHRPLRPRTQVSRRLRVDVEKHLRRVESILGARFGDSANPLLVSVPSGRRSSMPGMMETILNIGLNDATVDRLRRASRKSSVRLRRHRRPHPDVLRRRHGEGRRDRADGRPGHSPTARARLEGMKRSRGVRQDTELTPTTRFASSIVEYKEKVIEVLGAAFPEDR